MMECYYDCCNPYRIASQGYASCAQCECQYDGYDEYAYFEHMDFLDELKQSCSIPRRHNFNLSSLKIKRFWEVV